VSSAARRVGRVAAARPRGLHRYALRPAPADGQTVPSPAWSPVVTSATEPAAMSQSLKAIGSPSSRGRRGYHTPRYGLLEAIRAESDIARLDCWTQGGRKPRPTERLATHRGGSISRRAGAYQGSKSSSHLSTPLGSSPRRSATITRKSSARLAQRIVERLPVSLSSPSWLGSRTRNVGLPSVPRRRSRRGVRFSSKSLSERSLFCRCPRRQQLPPHHVRDEISSDTCASSRREDDFLPPTTATETR